MVRKFTAVVTLAIVLAVAGAWFFFLSPGPSLEAPRMVEIRRGERLHAIATSLQRAGIVRSGFALMLYARMSGAASRLQPGDYRFAGGETVPEVLGHIVRGESVFITVTVPEGSSVREIGRRLEMARLTCDWDFARVARTSPLVKELGLSPWGVEGYLFPATYRFAPLVTPEQILATMLERFFTQMSPQVEQRAFELGLTTRELVTLASIIEKEAKVPAERPLIAGVFYNRLRLHIPLQSDPTAQYSFEGITAPVARAVHEPSPFNTYSFTGLPPAPIANPGWDAIHAALYPTPTDYLYFVARKDGTHVFSRTLKEHDRAIADLRRVNFRDTGPRNSPEAGLPANRKAVSD